MSLINNNRIKTHIATSIQEHLDTSDCGKDESKMLSRALASIYISSISGLSYKDSAKYVTDGSEDQGIDGCYYDANKNRLHLVQTKWSSAATKTIDTGSIHKFVAGTYLLLDLKWNEFNDRFRKISAEIEAGLSKDPQIILSVVYNSDSQISAHAKKILDKFLYDNNSDEQDVVTYSVFGLSKIVRAVQAAKSGSKTDVELGLLEWGETKEPFYAITGKVCCADVAEWHKSHGELLFSENIRYTLSSSEINQRIAETLVERPTEFWYLNNGITAIADSLVRKPVGLGEQRESSLWNVGNLKIVNGAQTTSAIASAYKANNAQLRKAYVQIKVISLAKAPLDIAGQITTATNTQNRVEPRDFLALDTIQDGLAESFKKIGVQYCYRRGEIIKDPSTGLDVQELALTLATCSTSMTDVVMAKRNVGLLTDPNGHYPKLFSSNLDVSKCWTQVKQLRAAQKIVSDLAANLTGRDRQIAVHANRFLENRLLTRHVGTIDLPTAECMLHRLASSIETHFKDSYLAVLFKNAKKCEVLSQDLDA
jgi:hypothetical protein